MIILKDCLIIICDQKTQVLPNSRQGVKNLNGATGSERMHIPKPNVHILCNIEAQALFAVRIMTNSFQKKEAITPQAKKLLPDKNSTNMFEDIIWILA